MKILKSMLAISLLSMQVMGCSDSMASMTDLADKQSAVSDEQKPTINQACAISIINDIVGLNTTDEYDHNRDAKTEILQYCVVNKNYTASSW